MSKLKQLEKECLTVDLTRIRRKPTSLCALLAALAACMFLHLPAANADAKPNIVLIVADDMGIGDVGCYAGEDVKTPVIDRLAKQGVRLTEYYANGAECTPTRTALLTGAYQQRVGGLECAIGTGNVGRYDDAIRLAEKNDLGLPPGRAILPRALKDAGYATALFGKWHLGYEPKFNPLNCGFDEFFGILGGNADYWRHTEADGLQVLYEGRKPVKRDGYMTHLWTDAAVDFIKRNSNRPFFLFLSHTAPHFPYQDPDKDPGKLHPADEWSKGPREMLVKMVEDMDEQIGRVLKTLEDEKLADNTLVIFASDHGAPPPGSNGPLRGYKGGTLEGGIKTVCIARWPGRIEAGRVWSQPVMTFDLTRSLLRVAEAKVPRDTPLDGQDVLQYIEVNKPSPPRPLFWRARRGERTWRAVRDGDWKYVSRVDGAGREEWLFHLEDDPNEQDNLLKSQPKITNRLQKQLSDWEKEVQHDR